MRSGDAMTSEQPVEQWRVSDDPDFIAMKLFRGHLMNYYSGGELIDRLNQLQAEVIALRGKATLAYNYRQRIQRQVEAARNGDYEPMLTIF